MNIFINMYLPELILFIFIFINIIGAMFFNSIAYKFAKWISLLGISFSLLSTFFLELEPESYIHENIFISNIYTIFFKILILISGFCLVLLSRNLIREKRDRAFEFFATFLSGLFFSMCAVSSANFLVLYLSTIALSLCAYLLLSFTKSQTSKQLSLGYILQTSVFSSISLIGISYLYGITSKIDYVGISSYLSQNPNQIILSFVIILILCIFFFNLGLIPFSSWVSDTFKSTSAPICAYISCIPIITCFAVLPRLLMIMLNYTFFIKIILAIISVITILFASLSAIRQENLKKIAAYSMSVHSGIMLLGLCVFSVYSLSGVLFYLLCYITANMGLWAAIILLYNSNKIETLEDLKGLIYNRPYFVIALTTVIISLAGIAPTCGFVAKFYIASAVARSGFTFLPYLLIALLSSVILIYSYWRIIRALFRRKQAKDILNAQIISSKFILYGCAILTIIISIFSDKLIQLCQLVSYYM